MIRIPESGLLTILGREAVYFGGYAAYLCARCPNAQCKINPVLTRIYINNYRCLVNFELRLGRRQLIIGANGSGKSSVMDALLFLRRLVVLRQDLERHTVLKERTLWLNLPVQTFEIEATLNKETYSYRLAIEGYGEPEKARVQSETLTFAGKPVLEFQAGEVRLFDDQFQQITVYPFEPDRSALATLETKQNKKLLRFKDWFRNLLCFRINPFGMGSLAQGEDTYPFFELSNFAAWYRHLLQSGQKNNMALLKSLRAVLDGFDFLEFGEPISNTRLLSCEFAQPNGPNLKLPFDRLSDGQRCLISLYTILHFVIAKGYTVILDEPENFIALREIQPWLNEASASLDEGRGQVLIISHHPEFMNQWAPDFGLQFIREGMGQVRVKEFNGQAYSTLSPAEVVARGWEND